jgi:hypothetical protein
MAKPKVYRDTLNLLYLIDKISKDKGLPKRYRYGWYGDIQHISAEMLAEWHTSQLSATYDEKTEHLTAFLVKLNTIYSLLEVLIATQALPDTKLIQIFAHVDEIQKQIRGMRKYILNKVGVATITDDECTVSN